MQSIEVKWFIMKPCNQQGTLYDIIGTPIGTIEDISWRAARILTGAEVIVCEDTRVTQRLLGEVRKAGRGWSRQRAKPLLVRLG
jgi:16S rRNA C1402 (ribose-2'-O) methylase RsmI